MNKGKEVHKYKKGERMPLDHIYDIQGLAGGDWWDGIMVKDMEGHDTPGDEIIITKDVEIVITYKKKELDHEQG